MKPLVYAIATLFFSITVGASASAGGGHHGPPTFERLDKNGDGKIVESEVPAHVWLWLKQADTNNDNVVTKTEFEAAVAKGVGGPRKAPLTFEELDKNGDGKIVASEVAAEVWQWLSRADANKDNAVTKAEFEAALAQFRAKGPHGGSHLTFDRLDKNGDGKIVASEVPAQFWERLRQADTNKDNAVTKAEFDAWKAQHAGRKGSK